MSKQIICTRCGHQGQNKLHVKGSFLIEIILWLAFIVPGLIYSVWRITSKEKICSACGSKEIVPLQSPMGQKLIADFKK